MSKFAPGADATDYNSRNELWRIYTISVVYKLLSSAGRQSDLTSERMTQFLERCLSWKEKAEIVGRSLELWAQNHEEGKVKTLFFLRKSVFLFSLLLSVECHINSHCNDPIEEECLGFSLLIIDRSNSPYRLNPPYWTSVERMKSLFWCGK